MTAGGVSTAEIDPGTMGSRLTPGLFFAGEVMDVDGDCGYYNLQCWSSRRLAGAHLPSDRILDGKDIWPLMAGEPGARSPHAAFYYYQMDQLQAVRSGKWKLHLPLEMRKANWGKGTPNVPLALYDLETDIAEQNNVADQHPDEVKRLLALAEKAREDLGDENRPGRNQRPAGMVVTPRPLLLGKE